MDIVLTDHAKERLAERLGCHPSKFEKIARKAARSTEIVDLKRDTCNPHMYPNSFYRKFMGMIYCFDQPNGGTIRLRTMHQPAIKGSRGTKNVKRKWDGKII